MKAVCVDRGIRMASAKVMRSPSGKLMRVWREPGGWMGTPLDPDDWAAGVVEPIGLQLRGWTEQVEVCPECGDPYWDAANGSKLNKCWNAEKHASGGPIAFDEPEWADVRIDTCERCGEPWGGEHASYGCLNYDADGAA